MKKKLTTLTLFEKGVILKDPEKRSFRSELSKMYSVELSIITDIKRKKGKNSE